MLGIVLGTWLLTSAGKGLLVLSEACYHLNMVEGMVKGEGGREKWGSPMSPSFVPGTVLGTPNTLSHLFLLTAKRQGSRTRAQSYIAEKRQNPKADLLHSKALSRTTSPTSSGADRN